MTKSNIKRKPIANPRKRLRARRQLRRGGGGGLMGSVGRFRMEISDRRRIDRRFREMVGLAVKQAQIKKIALVVERVRDRVNLRPASLVDLTRKNDERRFALVGTSAFAVEGYEDYDITLSQSDFVSATKVAIAEITSLNKDKDLARQWYFTYSIAELGGMRPCDLVYTGNAQRLNLFLEMIAHGSYA